MRPPKGREVLVLLTSAASASLPAAERTPICWMAAAAADWFAHEAISNASSRSAGSDPRPARVAAAMLAKRLDEAMPQPPDQAARSRTCPCIGFCMREDGGARLAGGREGIAGIVAGSVEQSEAGKARAPPPGGSFRAPFC